MTENDVKFIADATLGKLVKWLRILGYDTVTWWGRAERPFLRQAAADERVALTRRRDLAGRQFSGRLVVIRSEQIEEQLPELLARLSLCPQEERFFSRCLKCNAPLRKVSREEVEGKVPSYIWETSAKFRACPRCGGIFWPGTHRRNMEALLNARTVSRHS